MAWERLANLDTDPGRQILLTPTLFPARALRRHLRFSSPGLSSLRPCCSLRSRVLKLACASKPCKCEPDSSTRTIGSFSGLPEGQARSSLSAQSLARNLDISPLSARCPLALVDAIGKSSRLQHALAVSFTRLVLSMWSSPALAALCLAVVRRRSVRDLARSRSVSSPRPTANKRRTRDMLAGDGDGPQPAWPTAIFFLLKFSYPTHNKLVISCHLQKQLAVLSFFSLFFPGPRPFSGLGLGIGACISWMGRARHAIFWPRFPGCCRSNFPSLTTIPSSMMTTIGCQQKKNRMEMKNHLAIHKIPHIAWATDHLSRQLGKGVFGKPRHLESGRLGAAARIELLSLSRPSALCPACGRRSGQRNRDTCQPPRFYECYGVTTSRPRWL